MIEKMPVSRKVIIGIAAFLAVAVTAGFIAAPNRSASSNNSAASGVVRTVPLSKGKLSSTISSTGTVYSVNVTNVYSSLNYRIKTVNVEVGDTVNAGDILAALDTESLEVDISQKQASVTSSQKSAQQSLAVANQELSTYRNNVANNYDTTLLNAESSLETAKLDLENSERDVKNSELDLQNAELDLQSANNELYIANRDLRQARKDGEDDAEIEKYKDTVRTRETAIDKAETSIEKAKSNLEKVKTTHEKAKQALEKAQATLDAAKASVNDNIASYENKVKSAQISNSFEEQYLSIQNLQSDLEKCNVIAPVSGTVTEVNAVEGGSGDGALFVIQSTDDLKVITNIKEYDVGNVSIGDKVVITTDATGDTEFSGKLAKIAPTSTLTAGGEASTSTDAEYKSEILVDSKSGGLKIGMNARLSIVTEEKNGIFYVPYEAVETTDDKSVIYVQNTKEDGTTSYSMLAVKTGMETNLYIEVSGDGLQEGMQVVRSAATLDKSQVEGAEAVSPGSRDGGASRSGQGNRQGGMGGMIPGGGMPGGGRP